MHFLTETPTKLHSFTPTPEKFSLLTSLKQLDLLRILIFLMIPLGKSINLNFPLCPSTGASHSLHLNDDLTKNNDKHMSELSSTDDNSHC